MSSTDSTWKVEIWAEDEDHRLPRDDRARELVKVTSVKAGTADEAKRMVLKDRRIRRRWPRANATAIRIEG